MAGPIPVRTGEPAALSRPRSTARAYPRAYGGTRHLVARPSRDSGLSPCVRGNRLRGLLRDAGRGPIPVRTGEPPAGGGRRPSPWAYPRAYGGTFEAHDVATVNWGLSPCVRGNLIAGSVIQKSKGPIPVRTGEPRRHARYPPGLRAYPRAYGGPDNRGSRRPIRRGLSPCVRGNLLQGAAVRPLEGPIPVRTGEPWRLSILAMPSRAYPRAYGGTSPPWVDVPAILGLSPCVRGNLPQTPASVSHRWPIPVRTGEPRFRRTGSRVTRAYPRAYGGTVDSNQQRAREVGLSPCVRGNLRC